VVDVIRIIRKIGLAEPAFRRGTVRVTEETITGFGVLEFDEEANDGCQELQKIHGEFSVIDGLDRPAPSAARLARVSTEAVFASVRSGRETVWFAVREEIHVNSVTHFVEKLLPELKIIVFSVGQTSNVMCFSA